MFLCLKKSGSVSKKQTIIAVMDVSDVTKLPRSTLLAMRVSEKKNITALVKKWRKYRGQRRRIEKGIVLAITYSLLCYSPTKVMKRFSIKNDRCKSF